MQVILNLYGALVKKVVFRQTVIYSTDCMYLYVMLYVYTQKKMVSSLYRWLPCSHPLFSITARY